MEPSITPELKVYRFNAGGYKFEFPIEWKDTTGMHPMDVLALEIEQIQEQLRKMPKFIVQNSLSSLIPPNDSN